MQYELLVQRSGLSYSLSSHIRSVDYCREIAAETFLGEDVLRDMIEVKKFGEAKAAICVKRQKAACAAHVPLCVPVDFGGSPSQICLSIHEPKIHSFSRLGRIMVTYNTQRNTWHCPCTKPRTSCFVLVVFCVHCHAVRESGVGNTWPACWWCLSCGCCVLFGVHY